MSFAELAAATNFSFLRGASHPDEMVLAAKALGLDAIGVADRNTLAGVVRAHAAAKEAGLRLIVGARLVTREGFEAIAYPTDRAAWGRLTRLLTLGNRRAPKAQCWLGMDDVLAHADGQLWIVFGGAAEDALPRFLDGLADRGAAYLALTRDFASQDLRRLVALSQRAESLGVKTVAVGDALFHAAARKPLADVLACIREHVTIDQAGQMLCAHAERHLKPPEEMRRLFRGFESAIDAQAEILSRIGFSLDELRYEYPDEIVAPGETAQQSLVRLTWEGAARRYPGGVPEKVRAAIMHEFKLIEELDYARYFLTVHDLVRFAESRGILCQGRGSAANSTVCYCLGVTAVDPTQVDLLFERFVSAERREPPDIDVDFEHERREEVIQYIYNKYGRHRAAIAATVITYRGKSAIREVGKALGLSADTVEALAKTLWGWSTGGPKDAHVRAELGLDPDAPRLRLALDLAQELQGFPRHLSQHTGGFVITRGPLEEVVPIGNAAMADRTFVEWDKDDLDALGMLKIDVLALGMLTCIAKAFEMLRENKGIDVSLATVPKEDPAVYDMICAADTIGVFQIESRAQMTMLPRLKPRCFYDLVIEVAIVRPGPIQGDMVHPYLRRREGREAVRFPSPELEQVLGKTLGVPLFQEQAMRIAIVAAGFSPAEADRLRRAMATFRKVGIIHQFGLQLVEGMVHNGYEREFAERCFKQIEGFGEYGFPESHAASFALLVYISAWLKRHHPDVFCAAILNAQPMGFYAPAQLVRCARAHGVEAHAPDVNVSDWDAVLEAPPHPSRLRRATLSHGGRGWDVLHPLPLWERVGRAAAGVRGHLLLQGAPNGVEGDVPLLEEIDVPNPQHPKAGGLQLKGALGVEGGLLRQTVLPAIEFEDQPRGETGKINHIGPDGDLSAEFVIRKTPVPQQSPHQSFRLAHVAPQSPGAGESMGIMGEAHGQNIKGTCDQPQVKIPPRPSRLRRATHPLPLWERVGRAAAGVRGRHPVRLGLREIHGFSEADAAKLVAARAAGGPFTSLEDLRQRARLSPAALEKLAHADAFRSLGIDRRRALWEAKALQGEDAPLFAHASDFGPEEDPHLPDMPLCEHVAHDYARLKLSLKAHPMHFFREFFAARREARATDLEHLPSGRRLDLSGLVLVRQRPGSAKGVIFMTLEDETGVANIIVWPKVFQRFRKEVLGARLIGVSGRVQKEGRVIHVVAERLTDWSDKLAELTADVDFGDSGLARADEVRSGFSVESRASSQERRDARAVRAAKILPKSRDFH